jgi:hypothetical protein
MDLTISTPIRFGITDSVMDSDYVTKRSPSKSRIARRSEFKKTTTDKKGFFKPKEDLPYKRPQNTEMVSGTLWRLQYSIGSTFYDLQKDMTTKELKAFLLSGGTTARATTAIAWIDSTLALAETDSNKYALYTAVDYNILELMTRVNNSSIFDGTSIGKRAEHYIEISSDQTANNAKHLARQTVIDQFDLTEDSKVYLASVGIIIE